LKKTKKKVDIFVFLRYNFFKLIGKLVSGRAIVRWAKLRLAGIILAYFEMEVSMKNRKNLWILPVALLAVFGLIMTGCPAGEIVESLPSDFNTDLVKVFGKDGKLEITLADNSSNSEWRSRNEAELEKSWDVTGGRKVVEGGVYYIKMKGSSDTAFPSVSLNTGLVNQSPSVGYWDQLTWNDGKGVGQAKVCDALTTNFEGYVEFTAMKSSTGISAVENVLILAVQSGGGAVKLTLTEFDFGRK
jgi:hypothetical protein